MGLIFITVLILKNEYILYGSNSTMLSIVSILSIILGVYVIISKNPVISILFLIGLFFSISMYLIIIGLHFLGLSYLLIYIGAVSIFFIFIVMLINIRVSELLTDNSNSVALAFFTVLLFNYFFNDILPFNTFMYDLKILSILTNIKDIFFNMLPFQMYNTQVDVNLNLFTDLGNNSSDIIGVTSKSWDTIIINNTHIASIGSILYTNLYILLVIISFILLLAMIGAIVITIGKKQ